MVSQHQFGGPWTRKKLDCLKKYLKAYIQIFTKNPKASYFTTNYVDAFAGTGYISQKEQTSKQLSLFFYAQDAQDALEYQKGSAVIALELEPSFDKYIFVELNNQHAQDLEKLKQKYTEKNIELIKNDSNIFLKEWCQKTDWKRNKSVLFLDPYGANIDWATLESIAGTKAIDTWILFPLGQAVNRLLTKNKIPPKKFSNKLTKIFGTDEWKKIFYTETKKVTFFGPQTEIKKTANLEIVGKFFLNRLNLIFEQVADPLPLCNSKNIPLYLFCFAAANPKGARVAVNIANSLTRSFQKWPQNQKSNGRMLPGIL
jgi:three-Cys-motif partner protein